MGSSRDSLRRQVERLEQHQVRQMADTLAYLQRTTGLPLAAIIHEAEQMAAYYRAHGEWPPAVVQAVKRAPTAPTIRLHWGDPTPQESTDPAPMLVPDPAPVPEPVPEIVENFPQFQQEQQAPEPEPKELRANLPEVDDGDEEADVDAELADLVAQLQRRLGR
jgi:hypothetical protein